MNTATAAVANVIPFDFRGHRVRVVMRAGEPWFVVVDVCAALGIVNPTQAADRLDDDERALCSTEDTSGRLQQMLCVCESGLYDLILGSRKAEAREFKRWVRKEVLPIMRKTGRYEGGAEAFNSIADLLQSDIFRTAANNVAPLTDERVREIVRGEVRAAIADWLNGGAVQQMLQKSIAVERNVTALNCPQARKDLDLLAQRTHRLDAIQEDTHTSKERWGIVSAGLRMLISLVRDIHEAQCDTTREHRAPAQSMPHLARAKDTSPNRTLF